MSVAAPSSTDAKRAQDQARAAEQAAAAARAAEQAAQQAAQQSALQTQQQAALAQQQQSAIDPAEQARTREATAERAVDSVEGRGRDGAALVDSSVRRGATPVAQPTVARNADLQRVYREGPPLTDTAARDPSVPENTRAQADAALGEIDAPGRRTPYGRHLEAVRGGLEKEGLPTTAENVRVVANDVDREHGGAVLRSATGDAGLGRNAESHLQLGESDPQATVNRLGLTGDDATRLTSQGERIARVDAGNATIADVARLGLDRLEGTVQAHRSELARVRELAQADPSKPTVANMSWGGTIQEEAFGAAQAALNAPPGSPLHRDLSRELGRAPRPEDFPRVARMMAERIDRLANDPAEGRHLRAAKAAYGRDLQEASEKDRVTVVHAAANQYEDAKHVLGNPAWSANITSDVPGQITVGATDLGRNPRVVGDERIAPFSSAGQIEVAAPGVQLPVGARQPNADGTRNRTPENIDGTSFAAPYVAGTVALMLQANPNLRTADIQQLLQSTARNIRGNRDGAGVVDPVAAVRAARAFRVENRS